MNKLIVKTVILLCALVSVACSKNEDAPIIDNVWKNMIAEPIEETTYAYPGQTICIHGSAFNDLKKVFVNGTDIDLSSSLIYDTDNYITFQLPADVNTSIGTHENYIRVITAHGESVYRPFLVKSTSEQPTITKFSSISLVSGRTLTITGTNLSGVTGVWLPLAFDKSVACELDPTQEQTATSVSVIIPDGVKFATGKCIIAMEKKDPLTGDSYTERVFSATTDFIN